MKNLEKLKRSNITALPNFAQIMENYDNFGRHMSVRSFHKTYVLPFEPKVTYKQWMVFIHKFEAIQKTHVDNKLKETMAKSVSAAQLESKSLDKVLKIANLSLDAIADNPELLTSIPLENRIKWLFQAMKARDSRLKTNVVIRQEEREQSMFEKMMEGAQYGGFDAEVVPESEDATQEIIKELNGQEQPV